MIDLETISNIFSEIINRFTQWFPTLVTALVVFVVGWAISRILGSVARRLSARFGLDRAFESGGLTDFLTQVRITQAPSDLLGRFVFWFFWISSLLITLDVAGLQFALLPLQGLIAFFPKILASLFILLAGTFLAQIIGRGMELAVAGMGVDFHETFGRVIRSLIVAVTLILAIQQLGLQIDFLTELLSNLLSIAAVGIAIAFGFGGKGVAQNLFAGHYAREQLHLGDRLEIEGRQGTLESIGSLSAEIHLGDGQRWIVPNQKLVEESVLVIDPTT